MSTCTVSLLDFAPTSGDDWYPALQQAVAYLTALGGGCLLVPKRASPYDCNVTSPIEITGDDITIELESGARLRNTSATGIDFFRFAGAAGPRNRVNFRGGRVLSAKTAGHIFTFTDDVGLGFADWTSEIVQLNPARSIIKGSAWTTSGLFSNRFGGPLWAHGSVSDPPTAPAVDINTTTNAFNANEFSMLRVNCHHGTWPFFSFINDAPLGGAFYSHNTVAVPTAEQARRFIKIAGALGFVARDLGFYDTQDLDYHQIETARGAGGRACEQCHFEDIDVVSILGEAIGVLGTTKIVTSLTRSASTATANAPAHGFGVGQRVYIAGANEAEYNGRFMVRSVPNAMTFTYKLTGTPPTPASGTITAAEAAMVIKIGAGDTGHTLVGVGGTRTCHAEVDLNHSGALVLGDYRRVGYYRAHLLDVNPMVFGAKFDGVTDDTAALQAAIDYAAAQTRPPRVVLPPGQAVWSDTLLVRDTFGLVIAGPGNATGLLWKGTAGKPGFKFDGCAGCELRGFRVTIDGASRLDTAIEIGQDAGSVRSTLNRIRNVELLLGGKAAIGIHVRLYDINNDFKNDWHSIVDCTIQDYTNAGIVIEGFNAKRIYIENTRVAGATTEAGEPKGQYGIDTGYRERYGGSFMMVGGMTSGNAGYDFRLSTPNDAILVSGLYSHSSHRWVTVLNDEGYEAPSRVWPIVFDGCRWATRNLPADRIVVDVKAAGPVTIRGCRIGGEAATGIFKFRYRPQGITGYATGALTVTGPIAHGETITIDTTTYTWRTALADDGGAPYEVKIGASTNESLNNLVEAIKKMPHGDGVAYGVGTLRHPTVIGRREGSKLIATALTPGTDGNSIATSTTMANASWGGPTLSGGTTPAFENRRGSFSILHSVIASASSDPSTLWTDLEPDDLTGTIHYDNPNITEIARQQGEPYDAECFVAQRDRDWTERGMPIPRVWHLLGSSTGHGEGVVLDEQRRYKVLDLHSYGVAQAQYENAIAPFTGRSVSFTGGTSQGMLLDDTHDLIDTVNHNVAMGFHGVLGQPSSNSRRLLVFGGNRTGAARGPFIGQQSDGTIRLYCDGKQVVGAYNYNDGAAHTIIGLIDHDERRLMVITDKEVLDFVTQHGWPSGVESISGKGFGTSAAQECWVGSARMFWVWYGPDVGRIRADGRPEAWLPTDIMPRLRSDALIGRPPAMPTGGLSGLELLWVSETQVRIGAGVARADDDTTDIRVASALTVDLTVSGAGGLDTGLELPDMWYSVWVISDSDRALPVAGLASRSLASPTLPTGYDHKRRVGWVRNDSLSNLLHFYQRGNGRTRRIHYDEQLLKLKLPISGSDTTFTDVPLSALVPPACDTAHLLCEFRAHSGPVSRAASLDFRPNGAASTDGPWSFPVADGRRFLVTIPTDAKRVIEYRVTSNTYDADIWVLGYDDEL